MTRMLAIVPAKTPAAAIEGVILPAEVKLIAVVVVVPLEMIPLRKLVIRNPAVPKIS